MRLGNALLRLLTLGLYGKRTSETTAEETGDEAVWPFFRREDFEAACANPKFLSGGGEAGS